MPGGWYPVLGIVLALLAAAAAAPSAAGAAVGEENETVLDELWFTLRPFQDQQHTFTTFPPVAGEASHSAQGDQEGFVAYWTWYLAGPPANWTVPAGARWEAQVWLSRLDEVIPLFDPGDVDTLGSIRIVAEVNRVTTVGTGAIYLNPLDVRAEPTAFRLAVDFPQGLTVSADEEPAVRIRLSVTGRALEATRNPALFHFGGTDTPSHLVPAGFPVAAYRAWEADLLGAQECHTLLLQQLACVEAQGGRVPPEEDPPTPAWLPAPVILPVVAALIVAWHAARSRDTERRAQPPVSTPGRN